jgi:hypothetical protein
MQVLTPSGYKSPAALANGDNVCAFDTATGAPIVNQIENIDFVDYAEWCRWWNVEATVPPYNWYRINGTSLMFGEQSIWRNGTNVCHVKDLVVGDVIYDDADKPITIIRIEVSEDTSQIWYRFDISGDHSYIVDGITVHNASRFWVSGTGTWDSSTTTHWGSSSGTADNSSVPGSADTVTFDGSSGGGTATLNFGGTITIQSLVCGNFGGTIDNSANNNNITMSLSGNAFNGSGGGTRTIKLGSATYTLSGGTATWFLQTATNLTFQCGTSTIKFTGTNTRSFVGGSQTYGTLNIGAVVSSGTFTISLGSGSGNTFANLVINAPNYIIIAALITNTVTNAVTWTGTGSSPIAFLTNATGAQSALALAAGSTMQFCSFRDMMFSGSPTATNSFDHGGNTGITITGPSGGSGTKFSGAFVG